MRTLPILANRYWNDTGVQLTEGARYRMTVVARRRLATPGREIHGTEHRWRGLEEPGAQVR